MVHTSGGLTIGLTHSAASHNKNNNVDVREKYNILLCYTK